MRFFAWPLILSVATLGLTGCHTGLFGSKNSTANRLPTPGNPVVTPANNLCGKIARVAQAGRFVVIVFPVGQLPRLEQKLNVYRNNLKVGEIKITGPQLDDAVVADLAAGEAQPGDEVRE